MVLEWEDKTLPISVGNQMRFDHVFLLAMRACGSCGVCVPCAGQDIPNPLIHALGNALFTQPIRFAQAFSGNLWESWENRVRFQAIHPTFPKFLNCTGEF